MDSQSEKYATRFMKWYGLPRPCEVVFDRKSGHVMAICSRLTDAELIRDLLNEHAAKQTGGQPPT